jgi:phosphoribosyl-ATP pyrophosphohydrolase
MTVEEVRESVVKIAQMERDPEAAHAAEDELYYQILLLAASGVDVKELADAAVATRMLDFPRWCA